MTKFKLLSLICFTVCGSARAADDAGIKWLVEYEGKTLPDTPWATVGKPVATLEAEGLRLTDDGPGFGAFRRTWQAGADDEIIVEARVKVGRMTGAIKGKTTLSLWPWRDGAPVSVLVSDGKHQDGLVLFPNQATNFTDRFFPMDTTKAFHTYRLVIHGTDMTMFVDGERKIVGQGAFGKPAGAPEPFLQFGSTAKTATGDALWEYVKLGVRQSSAPMAGHELKVNISEPWQVPERQGVKQTRPYLYDMGRGLLLLSVAQGPDAFYEPYGVLRSTDAGKTWTPIEGLDQISTAPLPMVRRPDGSILAISRWTRLQPDGSITGKTMHLNADATSFTMEDNRIILPDPFANETPKDQTICERHIWNDADGGVTMVLWTRKLAKRPDVSGVRWSHLMRSSDNGKTWKHFSTIGPGGEPAVARLNDKEMVAILRGETDARMRQTFSHDGGKTWSPPVMLEEGRVCPDLVPMSNGVLACSYGRPASCLMFSLDGGKSWTSHHVISDRVNFNYTSIREISPGRLLYIHDAPKLSCSYVDVARAR